jgi:CRP-like cAMP-binding protein
MKSRRLILTPQKIVRQPPDISPLLAALHYFHPLSLAAGEYLKKNIVSFSIRKKKLLLKEGAVCNYVYFIKKGAVRGFIREEQRDITTWITVENEMVTSISSLDVQDPSPENMQTIEDCELLAISYTHLQQWYDQFPESNIVIRKLLQKYYRDAEGRAFITRLTKAENKYKHFLLQHGHLANRIPLTYIASFLGITLETLSRVRKKLAARA